MVTRQRLWVTHQKVYWLSPGESWKLREQPLGKAFSIYLRIFAGLLFTTDATPLSLTKHPPQKANFTSSACER
jgi:hypothetical protein